MCRLIRKNKNIICQQTLSTQLSLYFIYYKIKIHEFIVIDSPLLRKATLPKYDYYCISNKVLVLLNKGKTMNLFARALYIYMIDISIVSSRVFYFCNHVEDNWWGGGVQIFARVEKLE